LERLFPKQFDGADGLSAGLAGNFLGGFEMNAILANLFRRDQIGRLAAELTELADAGVISLFGARADGQEFQIVGEGI
jgi:hypothetical protein